MKEEFKIGDMVVVNGYNLFCCKDGYMGIIKAFDKRLFDCPVAVDFMTDVGGWGDKKLNIKNGHGLYVPLECLTKVKSTRINTETQTKRYFSTLVEGLNIQIQLLKDAGIKIHDDSDFDFVIDYVYHSTAQDKVIVKFKNKGEIEE
jgi:hypothetical protein